MPILICMRKSRMRRTHPLADYSHKCVRCRECVGIYPSGQKALAQMADLEVVCDVCADRGNKVAGAIPLPGVQQEVKESVWIKGKRNR